MIRCPPLTKLAAGVEVWGQRYLISLVSFSQAMKLSFQSGADSPRLSVANSYSCCDWQFEEPVAMRLPIIIVEAGWLRGCWGVGHFCRRAAI